jgi:hypothetical protein
MGPAGPHRSQYQLSLLFELRYFAGQSGAGYETPRLYPGADRASDQSEGLEKIIEMMKDRHESIQLEIESLREVSSSLQQRMGQVACLQKINGLVADDGAMLLEFKRLPQLDQND